MKKAFITAALAVSLTSLTAPAFASHGVQYPGITACTADGLEVAVDMEIAGVPTENADVQNILSDVLEKTLGNQTLNEYNADPQGGTARSQQALKEAFEALDLQNHHVPDYKTGVYFSSNLYLTGWRCSP